MKDSFSRRFKAVLALMGLVIASSFNLAHAQIYDFQRFISGGAGGQDPAKRQIVTSMGSYICLGIAQGQEPRVVRMMFWSKIPQPNARLGAIAIDLGRHEGLIKNVSVGFAAPGVSASVQPGHTHAFLNGLNPRIWIDVPNRGHHRPEGFAPGRMLVLNATLGDGRTIQDVLNALHEGFAPMAQPGGLRIGVIAYYLLGGPPPGVGTINDDGGFVASRPAASCS